MPKYKPKFPKIVEAEGVDTSPLPREMPISTDESRYNTSKKTSGKPITDYTGNSNPYIDYQSIDLLLSLQKIIKLPSNFQYLHLESQFLYSCVETI